MPKYYQNSQSAADIATTKIANQQHTEQDYLIFMLEPWVINWNFGSLIGDILTRSSCPTSLHPIYNGGCDVPLSFDVLLLLKKKKKSSNCSMSPCQLSATESCSRCPEADTSLSMSQKELDTHSNNTCLGHSPQRPE